MLRILILTTALAGCISGDGFSCAVDADCAGGPGIGLCEVSNRCSFARSSCAVTQIRAGALGRHTCALRVDGQVVCWGADGAGQLGTSSRIPALVPGLDDVVDLATGEAHTCALRRDGSVRCWGANDAGQLGDGTTVGRSTPGLVAISGVVEIASGAGTTCARTGDGGVWCWGLNDDRQVNGVDQSQILRPVRVPEISGALGIAVGRTHGCAWSAEGTRCWGRNDEGQLGVGGFDERFAPTAISGMSHVRRVVIGDDHTCAVGDEHVWCWGDDEFHQLAADDDTDVAEPRLVDTEAVDVSASDEFTCSLTRDGDVYCWGRNDEGQLGIGSISPFVATPARIPGLADASEVALGTRHGCARVAGDVYCWGRNSDGELGDTTTAARLAPVAVKLPCE